MLTPHARFIWLLVAAGMVGMGPVANAEPVTIQGTVLLPNGAPAEGARVLLGYYATTGYLLAETQTDPAGKFALNVENLRAEIPAQALALKAGSAAAWGPARPGEVAVLRLGARSAALAGTVRDPEGKPAAGVEILLYSLTLSSPTGARNVFYAAMPSASASPLKATTGADGRFSLTDLPAGASVTYGVRAEGWAPMADQATVGQGEAAIVLAREARISGRVLAEGKPVAGMVVVGSGRYGSAQSPPTGADGVYILTRLAPGTFTLRVTNPPADLCSPVRTDVRIKSGDDVAGLDLLLTPGALLSGKVTEGKDGKPVAGVSVMVTREGREAGGPGAYFQTQTADQGTWQLRVPAGRYSVAVYRRPTEGMAEWVAEPRQRPVEAVEGEKTENLDFVLAPPPMIRGRVLRPDGTPAAGVEVFSTPSGYSSDAAAGKTDAEGRFSLPVRGGREGRGPRGEDRAGIPLLARYVEAGEVGLTFVAGPEEQADIRLAPGGYLLVTATDSQNRPVAEASILVYLAGGEGRFAAMLRGGTTDAQGKLRLGPLPTGLPLLARVTWNQQPYALDTAWDNLAPMTLAEKEEKEMPVLRLELQGRQVKGTVTDAEGKPAVQALVSAGPQQVAYTDTAGAYTLGGVPLRGTAWVLAMDATRPLFGVREVAVDETEGVDLRLQPLGAVTGTVVDAEGKPVAGAQIYLQASFQGAVGNSPLLYQRLREAGYTYGQVTTDEQGKWEARNLPAGVYRLNVSVPNKPDQLVGNNEVRVRGGETLDLGQRTVKAPVPGAPPGGPLPPPPPPPGAGGPAPKE